MIDQSRNTLDVKILRAGLLLLMRVLFRIEHRGLENVPGAGPLLIVANHNTYFDPFWIAVCLRRVTRFMAWDKIFKIPIAGGIFRWLGAFPVSLEKAESRAFKDALEILHRGEALMIFPEGGRSPDGNLQAFKEGAAHLALKLGVTILPVVVHGGERVWGPGMALPLPRKVWVEYLAPIDPGHFETSVPALTQQIRTLIQSRLQNH
jgi:1-acyl-sn-glycerol-3-phosphate acyltransferase